MFAWFVCSTPVEEVKKLTLITAIKTPYLEDGRFDLPAFDRLTNLQIQNGVEGIIVGGTTGEGQLMNWTDHIMLIGHACVCFGDKIKVIGKHSCKCALFVSSDLWSVCKSSEELYETSFLFNFECGTLYRMKLLLWRLYLFV